MFTTWKKAWSLLSLREQRKAFVVLAVMVVGALSAAVSIAAILPFLTVLINPGMIHERAALTWAFDTFGFETEFSFLIALGVATLAVIALSNAIQIAKVFVVARFVNMRRHSISCTLMTAFLRQPYEFFLDRHTGSMAKGVLSEADQVVKEFLLPSSQLVTSALTSLSVLAVVIAVNPVIAAVGIALFGGVFGSILALSRVRVTRLGRERREANGARFALAHEAFGGIKDLKVIGREASYLARFRKPSLIVARSRALMEVIKEVPNFIVQPLAFGGLIVLCLSLLTADRFTGATALDELLPIVGVFALAAQRIIPEMQTFYRALTSLRYGTAAVDGVHADVMLARSLDALPDTPPAPMGLRHELRLERIVYRYPGADRPALNHVDLTIRAGERIGVVGTTGSGKTTLADILLGLLRPESGRILVDGAEITDSNLRAWQQTIGYVPQTIFLCDGSIAENIAFGIRPKRLDLARVEMCARFAQLHDFVVDRLPDGYATTVGERGVRLSGGQRQRVGVARALYHDADLILFDEATSALDNVTEHDIIAAIDRLASEKTVLMIAHRLSTVRRCNRILLLENGSVAGFGPWDELMASHPGFRALVELGKAA